HVDTGAVAQHLGKLVRGGRDVDADDPVDARVSGQPGGQVAAGIGAHPGPQDDPWSDRLGGHPTPIHAVRTRAGETLPGRAAEALLLAETTTLDAGLAQQFAVLLLGHTLAALL